MPLTIERHLGESIIITVEGRVIEVMLWRSTSRRADFSVTAPRDVKIHRKEVWQIIHRQEAEASKAKDAGGTP